MPNYGPLISTDNLIFLLDPANPNCFGAGDSIAYDLINNRVCQGASGQPMAGTNVATPANMPIYSSSYGGVFNFSGGKGINVDSDMGHPPARTLALWVYKNSTATQYLTDARSNAGTWFLSNYSSYNITHANNTTYNFQSPYATNTPAFINDWLYIVIAGNTSGNKIYINGRRVAEVSTNPTDMSLGKNFRIGTRYTYSSHWTGLMGPIQIWSAELTAPQILCNYNANKGRFGL